LLLISSREQSVSYVLLTVGCIMRPTIVRLQNMALPVVTHYVVLSAVTPCSLAFYDSV